MQRLWRRRHAAGAYLRRGVDEPEAEDKRECVPERVVDVSPRDVAVGDGGEGVVVQRLAELDVNSAVQ